MLEKKKERKEEQRYEKRNRNEQIQGFFFFLEFSNHNKRLKMGKKKNKGEKKITRKKCSETYFLVPRISTPPCMTVASRDTPINVNGQVSIVVACRAEKKWLRWYVPSPRRTRCGKKVERLLSSLSSSSSLLLTSFHNILRARNNLSRVLYFGCGKDVQHGGDGSASRNRRHEVRK